MDSPKTVTVSLNGFAQFILNTYDIPDISDMVNKAIESYFDYDYQQYKELKEVIKAWN